MAAGMMILAPRRWPKYSRDEKSYRQVAAQIQPLYHQTRLQESSYEGYWGGPISEYNFQFQRVVDGYIYPDNGINVRVDANELEVISYRFVWDQHLKFPSADDIIDNKAAQQIFLDQAAPRLIYRPSPVKIKERPLKLVCVSAALQLHGGCHIGDIKCEIIGIAQLR